MKNPAGNLWRYQLFQAIWLPAFFAPVIVLFWQENGLDPFEIYLLQGLFALAVVLLEVPTGMVADRLGKRQSLLAGTVAIALGFIMYATGNSFIAFLVAEIVLAVGVTLLSGADSALLYDTLTALGRQDEFRRHEGRAVAIQLGSMALFTSLGGVIGEHSLRATLWLSAAGPILAFFVALGFVEANPPGARGSGAASSYGELIRQSLLFVRRHRLVRWYALFLAVLTGSATWLLWLYQPYMEFVGLPIVAFGFVFAGFNLTAALASQLAQRTDDALGPTRTLGVLVLLQVMPPLVMAAWLSPWALVAVAGHQMVRGMGRVIISDRILRYTFADKRATVLSLATLAGRLFFALTAPLIGWVARAESLSRTLVVQGGLIAAVLLGLVLLYRRIPAKYFAIKESVQARQ